MIHIIYTRFVKPFRGIFNDKYIKLDNGKLTEFALDDIPHMLLYKAEDKSDADRLREDFEKFGFDFKKSVDLAKDKLQYAE